MGQLIKDFIIYGSTSAFSGLIGVLLLPIYTRIFSPSEYGIIELITIATAILSTIAGMQLDSALARYFYERDGTERVLLISTGFVLRLFFAVCIFLIFFYFRSDILTIINVPNVYEWPIIISSLTIPLNAMFSYILVVLRLNHSAIRYGILAIGYFASNAVICIIMVVHFNQGVKGVFLGPLIAGIVFTILGVAVLREYLALSFSSIYAKDLLIYGLPIVPTVIISWLRSYIDRFLLLPIIGLSGVGIFSTGIRISSVILFIVTAFTLAWVPFSMEIISKPDHKDIFSKILNLYTAFLCCVTVILSEHILV